MIGGENMEIKIGFEGDEEFELGVNGHPRYVIYPDYQPVAGYPTYWDRGGWKIEEEAQKDPPNIWAKFEPETTIVHSGARSAKLWLKDPYVSEYGRLEILMDYDPLADVDLWNEAWYYIPSTVFADSPVGSWMVFHRIIYERLYAQDRVSPSQQANINLGIFKDGRTETMGQWMFLLGIKGDVDNDNDGSNDFTGQEDLYSNDPIRASSESWNLQKVLVPFDTWLKVKTFVHRDTTNFENGAIKVWIDLNDGQGERLIWDLYVGAPPTGGGTAKTTVRTIGIDPNILVAYPRANPGATGTPPYSYGFVCAGFGQYTMAYPGMSGQTYIDDISITKGKYVPPTPISPLAIAAVLAIPTVAVIWWLTRR